GTQPAATPYNLSPDDYVTAVVPIKNLGAIQAGFRWGRAPDGKTTENIGVPGHFHFQTRFGTTYVDTNQNEIILDYKGYDKGVDRFPDPHKQLDAKRRDTKKYGSPEGLIDLAEWCLHVGLPDDAAKILKALADRRDRDTFEAQNLAADGFHARRENLAVFSGRRLDKASVNFEQLVKDVYRISRPEDLAKPKLPNLKDNASAPKNYKEYARASTLA